VGVGEPAPAPPPGGDGATGGSGSSGGSANSGGAGAGGSAGVDDGVPPRLSVRTRRTRRSARLLSQGLPVRLRCSERCTVRVVLRRGRVVITRPARVSLTPGVWKRVVVRLNGPGRVRLRRHRSSVLALMARATDAAGNRRTLNFGLRVSR
jgi:hypothetical protein